MQEPQIKSLARPLSWQDREELGEIRLSDYNYAIGFTIEAWSKDGQIPKEVGSFEAFIFDKTTAHSKATFSLDFAEIKSCKELLSQRTIDASRPKIAEMIESR